MIAKERLQELIEQGATVYEIFSEDFSNFTESRLIVHNLVEGFYRDIELSDLYEHKADAEWELEFGKGKVTRTEELNIPNYNEFKGMTEISFYKKDVEYILTKYARGYNPTRINISTFYWDDALGDFTGEELFDKPHNEEDYTEACRLIKKLFMGEEL